ncbi:MAG: MFS transporter [Bdellovibrio sp.]
MNKFKLLVIMRSIFGTESFSAPIIAFFYLRHIGISFSEYSFSLMLMFFIAAFMQVPTGMISDRLGRKKVLIVGELTYAFTWLLIILFPSRSLFYISALILPIASALSAGNLESLAYEALSGVGKEDEFKRIMKSSSNYAVLGGAIAGILGGFIAQFSIVMPLAIDTGIIFAGAISSWIILPQEKKQNSHRQSPGFSEIFKTAIEFSQSSDQYLNKILISAVLFAVVRTLFTIYGPLLSGANFDLSKVGLIIGCLTFTSFTLIKFLPNFTSRLEEDYKMEIAMIVFVIISGLLGLSSNTILASLLIQQILRVFTQYYSRYYINKCIPADHPSRVTLLSFSFLVNLTMAGTFGAIESYLISISNVNVAFTVICLSAGAAVFYLSRFRKDNLLCKT